MLAGTDADKIDADRSDADGKFVSEIAADAIGTDESDTNVGAAADDATNTGAVTLSEWVLRGVPRRGDAGENWEETLTASSTVADFW